MDKQGKIQISKELERFHCSILLDELKENVRKLKAYGVNDVEIEAAMDEEEFFPQANWIVDYINDKILPLKDHVSGTDTSDAEAMRRAKKGV